MEQSQRHNYVKVIIRRFCFIVKNRAVSIWGQYHLKPTWWPNHVPFVSKKLSSMDQGMHILNV